MTNVKAFSAFGIEVERRFDGERKEKIPYYDCLTPDLPSHNALPGENIENRGSGRLKEASWKSAWNIQRISHWFADEVPFIEI
jgi:hypothetical protein